MAKGSVRRFLPVLAGLLALLGGGKASPAPEAAAGLSPGPAWWEVRLLVTVRGEYRSWEAGGGPRRPAVAGDYTYRARWEGRLEPDGDDFLLVHLKTEVLEWRLGEKAGPPGEETRLEAPPASAPELRLDYVLREGRSLEFSIGLDGCIDLPLHGHRGKISLLLPRSASRPDGPGGDRYDDFLTAGSNSIVLPGDGPRPAEARTVLLRGNGNGASWGPRPGPASPTGPASATRTRSRPSSPSPPADPRAVRPADGTCRRRGGSAPG